MSPLFNSGALLCEVTDGQIKAELGAEGGKNTRFSFKGIYTCAVGMGGFSEELSDQLCHCSALQRCR